MVMRFSPVAAALILCSVFPVTGFSLTLAEAEQRALAHNPALSAAGAAAEAAAGDAQQAGLLPNPEFTYSRQNLGNSRLTGLDGSSSTWQLSQRFESGRSARRDTAQSMAEAEQQRVAQGRRLLLAEVRSAWVEVLAGQQSLAFATELGVVASQTRDVVAAQVQAGKVSPVELKRLEVAMATLQRREQQARLNLQAARYKLAALQGLSKPDFETLPPELPAIRPLPPQNVLLPERSPALLQAQAETRSREAGVRVAKAGRLPSVTVNLGQTRYEDAGGESSWQMGIGVPLPLFDRNQGAVTASEARLREARAREEATAQTVQSELATLYPQVQGLEQQLQSFGNHVLPASEEAYQAISKGYRYGKFALLDVLDAQRALIDTRFDYLDTLTEYHRQRNRLDALSGAAAENSQ